MHRLFFFVDGFQAEMSALAMLFWTFQILSLPIYLSDIEFMPSRYFHQKIDMKYQYWNIKILNVKRCQLNGLLLEWQKFCTLTKHDYISAFKNHQKLFKYCWNTFSSIVKKLCWKATWVTKNVHVPWDFTVNFWD